MPEPEIITLGCRLNIAESETIRQLLGDDDVIVVNSCAVTNAAVKQTRAAIRQAHRRRPSARIAVTGCAAQIDPTSRSEEHTSELQSLMRISYAVFCLKKKKKKNHKDYRENT